jgi:hypothetical protein
MKNDEIKSHVNEAIGELLIKDEYLLEIDAGERAIVGRLQQYLMSKFPDFNVDTEYDRHGINIKRIILPQYCRNGGLRRVVPDLVVHKRGSDNLNILAVEIKKETNHEPRDCDRAKLASMIKQLHYQLGVFIELPAGPDAGGRKPRLEWLEA